MKVFTQTMAKAEEITRESIAICFKKQNERKKKRDVEKRANLRKCLGQSKKNEANKNEYCNQMIARKAQSLKDLE